LRAMRVAYDTPVHAAPVAVIRVTIANTHAVTLTMVLPQVLYGL